jgi:hypothetical protein
MRPLLAILLALLSPTAHAGTLVQRVNATDSTAGLSLTITPPPLAAGEQLYLAAQLDGQCANPAQWYAFDGQGWKRWSGLADDLPPVTLGNPNELILLQQLDLTAYPRVHFYAGIGSSPADMLKRANYEVFYRYFGTTTTCPAAPK